MTEQQIQTKVIKRLEELGYYVVKTIAVSRAGVPDLICCSPSGAFLAIEVKTPEGVVSELQKWNLERIARNKGDCAVIRSVRDLNNFLFFKEHIE